MLKFKSILNSQFSILKSQSGQSLVEVLIALAVGIIIIGAMVMVVISSLNNEQFGTSQNQSTQIAQEGLDIMREASQSDWNSFATNNLTNYCLSENSTNLVPRSSFTPGECPQNVGTYVREITIIFNGCTAVTPPPTTNAKVTSRVKWTDGKCTTSTNIFCHQVELSSCFFKPSTGGAYP
jgi:Tfp pilus assembly protein PilV